MIVQTYFLSQSQSVTKTREGTYFSRICSTVSKIRSAPTSGICGGKAAAEELMGILQQQNELRLPLLLPNMYPENEKIQKRALRPSVTYVILNFQVTILASKIVT